MNTLRLSRSLRTTAAITTMVAACLSAAPARAQWTSQTIQLRPGWNAIYLEVQPEPQACDALFAGLPVESAWRFNRKQAAVQFIDDPNALLPNQPDWLTWLPPSHPLAFRSQLFILEGGRPYLIKLADSAAPLDWTVRGVPVLRRPDWLSDSLNFVGFGLPVSNPPTFQVFFTNAPGLATNPVYRLTNGIWVRVLNPATTPMRRGESFCIRSTGLSDFSGPLEVQLNRRVGITFGRALVEESFRIRNPSTNLARTIVVRQLPSESPPSPDHPALAGSVPLSYWQDDAVNKRSTWANFASPLVFPDVPAGGSVEIRLAVRRRDMPPFDPPPGVSAALYQSLLEVADAAGTTRALIPVSAEGMQAGSAGAGYRAFGSGSLGAAPATPSPYAGLWIGNASIEQVSTPTDPVAKPVAAAFPFRILMHVDGNGQALFLQRIIQMWKPGTYKPAGDGTTNRVIDQPGRLVLYTDESRVPPGLTGAALVDGEAVARKFSSAAFGFRDPIPMTGNFGADGNMLLCDVLLDYDDPLNPFRHAYHPDHDNLDDRSAPLTVRTNATGQRFTTESYSVTRQIELTFQSQDPENRALAGWGDKQVGGVYQETITGLHSASIVLRGTFRLQLACEVPTLNP